MASGPPKKSLYRRKLPKGLIELSSTEGKRLFAQALANGDAEAFFPLVSHFQTQSHPALCGLTTLSTILNALQIDPQRVWEHPWRWFAESLLECCLDMERVKSSGVTIDELARIARCQGVYARVVRGADVDETRNLVLNIVRGKPDGEFEFLVGAYDRKKLGQTGAGHFSPIAAYNAETDSVLVLDVARFKYDPHWIPLQVLVEATKPLDTSCGLPRGFMLFSRKESGDKDSASPPGESIAPCTPETCSPGSEKCSATIQPA